MRVHGPWRGAHGRDGLPGKPQSRAQISFVSRIQKSDDARDVRCHYVSGRGTGREWAVRGKGSRSGTSVARAAGNCNAVYDAVGIRIDEVPITPDKVLKAIRAKAKGQEGRYGPSA